MKLAAGLGVALVLGVVIAAAGIRLGTGIPGLRIVHRIAASLEVVVVLWLGWMVWRTRSKQPSIQRAAVLALGLTVLLSAIGILAGQEPPPAAAAANLLGGLALAATFAWILGKAGSDPFSEKRVLTPFLGVALAVQIGLGAWLSIVDRVGMALPAHGMLALALAALLVCFAKAKPALQVLALAAPLAGFTALHYEYSAGAALGHAALAALLLAATAYAAGRGA